MRATELELTTAKNSWPPWLSKTLSSIKEVANKKDFNFTYGTNLNQSQPTATFVSHVNPSFTSANNVVATRRDSVPCKTERLTDSRRDSAPLLIKDSQSCSSLKTHN